MHGALRARRGPAGRGTPRRTRGHRACTVRRRWISISVRLPSRTSPSRSLPYALAVAHDVEQVVLDLEGRAQREPEAGDGLEVGAAPRPDQRADAQRQHRRVRARLAAAPCRGSRAASGRSTLSARQPSSTACPATVCSIVRWNSSSTVRVMREPRFVDVVEQRTEAERRERVAGVERDRHAVLDVHRRAVRGGAAAVLDVVVDQERGVEQLDAPRRRAARRRRSRRTPRTRRGRGPVGGPCPAAW